MVTSLLARSTYQPALSSLSAVWPGQIQESTLPFPLFFNAQYCPSQKFLFPRTVNSGETGGWCHRLVAQGSSWSSGNCLDLPVPPASWMLVTWPDRRRLILSSPPLPIARAMACTPPLLNHTTLNHLPMSAGLGGKVLTTTLPALLESAIGKPCYRELQGSPASQ